MLFTWGSFCSIFFAHQSIQRSLLRIKIVQEIEIHVLSIQTAISRCAWDLSEENLFPLYFWRHAMPETNTLLVLPFKSYFLFHLFLKSNFIKLLFFRLTRKWAVFNYLPRALMIPPLIYLTYGWLCVFLFWKMQFGDEAFCQWRNPACDRYFEHVV